VSNMWMQGFMRRRGMSMRLRTTTKEINTDKLQTIAWHFRNKCAATCTSQSHALLFNMDETPIYLDAPGNRTIDKIGAKTVEIATTKHDNDRVTLVLCVSCAGMKIDALIIHRCHEKKKMKKTNNLFQRRIDLDDQHITLWTSYSPKAYMNQYIMAKWIEHIYKPHITAAGHDPHDSILFMDNMGAHDVDNIEVIFKQHQLRTVLLPPNCTPILQPLDHSINALFKRYYEEEWSKWYREIGCKRLTRHNNKKKATAEDVNRWVVAALQRITPELIRSCWRHTLMLSPDLMRLPSTPWEVISAFFTEQQRVELLPLLTAHRSRHDGSQFVFPVRLNKRRKREQKNSQTNSNKRRRIREKENSQLPLTSLHHPPSYHRLRSLSYHSKEGIKASFLSDWCFIHDVSCRVSGLVK